MIVNSVRKNVCLVDAISSLLDLSSTRYVKGWHACHSNEGGEVEVTQVNRERFDELAKGLVIPEEVNDAQVHFEDVASEM